MRKRTDVSNKHIFYTCFTKTILFSTNQNPLTAIFIKAEKSDVKLYGKSNKHSRLYLIQPSITQHIQLTDTPTQTCSNWDASSAMTLGTKSDRHITCVSVIANKVLPINSDKIF